MFDTIILLAGQAEHGGMLSALRAHNPQLSVATSADLAALDSDRPERAGLITFVTAELEKLARHSQG